MQKIIFYFPYRGIGGVSLLFKRLSLLVVKHRKVYLVDFTDGCMAKDRPECVNHINYNSVSTYPKNSVVIFQSIPPWNILDINKFPSKTRILFWNLHPLNLYPYIFSIYKSNRCKKYLAKVLIFISFFRKRKLEKVVRYLNEKNALFFMDGENYKKTCEFFPNIKIKKKILPIFSMPGRLIDNNPRNVLRCCWIGRIADFKVHILGHLIERLDRAVSEIGPLEIVIVGSGGAYRDLNVYLKRIKLLKIRLIDNVEPEELDNFLDKNVDVLFAMGTSALEGASKGIPTFLLDYSFKKISGFYRFRYIYETLDYSLGEEISSIHIESNSTLEEKLINIRSNYKDIGLATYEFWKSNFSPEFVKKEFIKLADQSSANIGEMSKLGFFKIDLISYIVKNFMYKLKKRSINIHGFGDY